MTRPAANILLPVVGLLLLLSQVIYGADREKDLEGIKRKIKKEKQGIVKVKEEEGSVLQSLEKIEKRLAGQISRLKVINASFKAISLDLQKREREEELLSLSLRVRRRLFKKRARALYKWQRGGSPFILLNGGGVCY